MELTDRERHKILSFLEGEIKEAKKQAVKQSELATISGESGNYSDHSIFSEAARSWCDELHFLEGIAQKLSD